MMLVRCLAITRFQGSVAEAAAMDDRKCTRLPSSIRLLATDGASARFYDCANQMADASVDVPRCRERPEAFVISACSVQ
jgi:hypothetical protein